MGPERAMSCPSSGMTVGHDQTSLRPSDPPVPVGGRAGWLNVVGGIGAIAIPLTILFSFFTADDDYEDTAAGLIAYAKGHESDIGCSRSSPSPPHC